MSKRFLLAAILAAVVAGGTFAQAPLSIGGGFLAQIGTQGRLEAMERYSGLSLSVGLDDVGLGGFFFLDTTYAELAMGVTMSVAELSSIAKIGSIGIRENFYGPIISMDVSYLSKFPMEASPKITLFPLLGIGYSLVFFSKMYDDDDKEVSVWDKPMDLSTFRFIGGFGYDVNFGNNVFFRSEALVYLGLPSNFFKEGKRKFDKDPDIILTSNTFLYPYGVTAKVAIGYRF